MRTKPDMASARELALYAENEFSLYQSRALPIIANLARKKRRGIYDDGKAIKAWLYLADDAAKKYAKEYSVEDGRPIFDLATRWEAARELRDHYAEAVSEKAAA